MLPGRSARSLPLLLALLGAWAGKAQAQNEVRGSVLGPFTASGVRFVAEVVAIGFQALSGLAFLPDGRALTAERPNGRLSLLDPETGERVAIQGVPPVYGASDAGLIDVIIHPDFPRNHLIYYSYSAPGGALSTTVVERARLEGDRLVEAQRLFMAVPWSDSAFHYGGRLVLSGGYLFITVGERDRREQAQDRLNDNGKIIRLTEDGRIPPDNPFVGRGDTRPEIWTLGHRNPQGLVLNPFTGELWEHEHGPKGGDEVNLILPGRNYGWPIITYGREYSGETIGDGWTWQEGMEQPLHYYTPSIAPSGMDFYTGQAFPEWHGNLFIGAMAPGHLNRLVISSGQVVKEERLLSNRRWRVRMVRQGPKGYLYLGIDRYWLGDEKGMLIRLRPAN
jgi:glucose/arabinose dehydrogenase